MSSRSFFCCLRETYFTLPPLPLVQAMLAPRFSLELLKSEMWALQIVLQDGKTSLKGKSEKNLWVKIKTVMKENEIKQPQNQSSDAKAVSHHLQPDAQPGRDLLWQNSPQFYLWLSHYIWYEMCLWSVWGSCPSCPPSQPSPPPSACSQGQQSERWRRPWHCAGTAVTKTLLCVINSFGHQSKPQDLTGCCEENELDLNQTLYRQMKRVHGDCQPRTAGGARNKN